MGGFASGMQVGAGMSRAAAEIAERLRQKGGARAGFTTRPPSAITASIAPDQRSTKDPAAEAIKTERYLQSRQEAELERDRLFETRKVQAEEQQAQDFQMAAAALSVGDTGLAQEYINRYGDSRMNVSIAQGEGGKLIVTPSATSGGKPMEFGSARDLYSNFFGLLSPKGSDFSMPQAAQQSWKAFGDAEAGFHVLDQNSGAVQRVTQAIPREGAGGGPGALKPTDFRATLDLGEKKLQAEMVNKFVQGLPEEDRRQFITYNPRDPDSVQFKETWSRVYSQLTPEQQDYYRAASYYLGEVIDKQGVQNPQHAVKLAMEYAGNTQRAREIARGPQPGTTNNKGVPGALPGIGTAQAAYEPDNMAPSIGDHIRSGANSFFREPAKIPGELLRTAGVATTGAFNLLTGGSRAASDNLLHMAGSAVNKGLDRSFPPDDRLAGSFEDQVLGGLGQFGGQLAIAAATGGASVAGHAGTTLLRSAPQMASRVATRQTATAMGIGVGMGGGEAYDDAIHHLRQKRLEQYRMDVAVAKIMMKRVQEEKDPVERERAMEGLRGFIQERNRAILKLASEAGR